MTSLSMVHHYLKNLLIGHIKNSSHRVTLQAPIDEKPKTGKSFVQPKPAVAPGIPWSRCHLVSKLPPPIAIRRWRGTTPISLPDGWVLDSIADPASREDISSSDAEFSWSTLIYSNENTISLLSQATPGSKRTSVGIR